MNYPSNIRPKEVGIEESDLHELAGLIDAGIDEEGNQLWLGNSHQWAKYEELTKEYESS